jgi:hypothetical protein
MIMIQRLLGKKKWHAAMAAAILAAASWHAHAQAVYAQPQQAAAALFDAVSISDDTALARVLGPRFDTLVPEGVDQEDVYEFLAAAAAHQEVRQVSDREALWYVGASGWTFPVPIARVPGGWRFDMAAGRAEVRRRTVGRNELAAIDVLGLLGQAQKAYADLFGHGDYAHKLISTQGRRDGLYWPQTEGEPDSPVGPDALAMTPDTDWADAFYGYHYRIVPLTQADYALYAWPARAGTTGVHAYAYLSNGQIYQRRGTAGLNHLTAARLLNGETQGWTRTESQ